MLCYIHLVLLLSDLLLDAWGWAPSLPSLRQQQWEPPEASKLLELRSRAFPQSRGKGSCKNWSKMLFRSCVARWAFNEGIDISCAVCPELSCISFVFVVTWHPSFRDPTAFGLFKQLLTSTLVASFHLCCSCTVVWIWYGMSFCCHWNKQLRVLHLSWSVFQSQCCDSTLKRVFSAPLLPLFFCEWASHPKPYSSSSSLVVAVMCFWNTNYIVSQNPDFSSSCSLISQQYCTDLLPSTQAEHQPARANSVEIMFIIIIWSDIWFKHT